MIGAANPFDDASAHLRGKIAALYALLIAANAGAWTWALAAFHDRPLLLGTAALAYSFGLRHAFDADHIAAIDAVTRTMMAQGRRPIAVGFFFSLGHSTVVVGLSVAIAATAAALQGRLEGWKQVGGVVGTGVSAAFLLVVAAANVAIFVSVYRLFRAVRAGGTFAEEDLDRLLSGRGLLGRLFRPLFGLVRRSWHMYPLGFLFGLGFDTATEVGLLGISATEASQGASVWSILVFPALFTAAMTLVDTTDSILMLGLYGWAFVKPIRKLYYNMTITLVSVIVALLVGGVEALGLFAGQFGLKGGVWDVVASLGDDFGTLGAVIVALFVVTWVGSVAVYRFRRYDEIGAETA